MNEFQYEHHRRTSTFRVETVPRWFRGGHQELSAPYDGPTFYNGGSIIGKRQIYL